MGSARLGLQAFMGLLQVLGRRDQTFSLATPAAPPGGRRHQERNYDEE
jgi:hypothetical protein